MFRYILWVYKNWLNLFFLSATRKCWKFKMNILKCSLILINTEISRFRTLNFPNRDCELMEKVALRILTRWPQSQVCVEQKLARRDTTARGVHCIRLYFSNYFTDNRVSRARNGDHTRQRVRSRLSHFYVMSDRAKVAARKKLFFHRYEKAGKKCVYKIWNVIKYRKIYLHLRNFPILPVYLEIEFRPILYRDENQRKNSYNHFMYYTNIRK